MIRVVKVGGSLFDLPRLAASGCGRGWPRSRAPTTCWSPAAGRWSSRFARGTPTSAIDETAAHWMCVDLLTVTAHLLHAWLPEIPLVEDDGLLCQRVGEDGATIFGPAPWMRHAEPGLPGTWLPTSWETTSDSIAGRLAVALRRRRIRAAEIRAAAAPRRRELSALAAVGYIDPMLAQMAPELPPTRLVNFRADPPAAGPRAAAGRKLGRLMSADRDGSRKLRRVQAFTILRPRAGDRPLVAVEPSARQSRALARQRAAGYTGRFRRGASGDDA